MPESFEGVDLHEADRLADGMQDVGALGDNAVRHSRRAALFALYGFIPLVALGAYRWTIGFLALTAIALAFAAAAALNSAHGSAHRRYHRALLLAFAANAAYVPRLLEELHLLGDGGFDRPSLFNGAPPTMALGIFGFILLALGSLQTRQAETEAHAALETERHRQQARSSLTAAMERGKAHPDPGPLRREEIAARLASGEKPGPMRPTTGPGTPSHVNIIDERHPKGLGPKT